MNAEGLCSATEVVLSAQLADGLQAAVNLETVFLENRGGNKVSFNWIPVNAAARRQSQALGPTGPDNRLTTEGRPVETHGGAKTSKAEAIAEPDGILVNRNSRNKQEG